MAISESKQAYQNWAKFLEPESLKSNLIIASMYLAAFELLKSSVIERIRNFFTYEFNEHGGVVSEDYKDKVLSLDKSPLRASLLWLKEMSAICDADIELIDNIRKHRNELAHELPKFIGIGNSEININLLVSLYELVAKIDHWWIKEIDLSTNSDFDGQEVTNADIQSGLVLCMQMMTKIALDEDASEIWNIFQNAYADQI